MKKTVIAVIAFTMLFITGCFESRTVIKVKKDGSGTIHQTMLISKEAMEGMMGMAMQMGGNESKDLYDEIKIKEEAATMGDGVTYISSKKLERDGKTGYEAVFAFEDINTLKISENPGEKMMGGQSSSETNFNFKFKKGNTSQLNIEFPIDENEDEETEEKTEEIAEMPEMNEEMTEMMKAMYKGLRFSIEVEFDGKITDTNASYKEGNKIVILDMDFDELAKDPEKLKSFQNMQNPDKMKEALKNIPGMKVETNEKVMVKFQ